MVKVDVLRRINVFYADLEWPILDKYTRFITLDDLRHHLQVKVGLPPRFTSLLTNLFTDSRAMSLTSSSCIVDFTEDRQIHKVHILPKRQGYRACSSCGLVKASLPKCSKCKAAWYCDATCQTQHWPAHKRTCTQNHA